MMYSFRELMGSLLVFRDYLLNGLMKMNVLKPILFYLGARLFYPYSWVPLSFLRKGLFPEVSSHHTL